MCFVQCRAVQTYLMTRPTGGTIGTNPKPADPTYSSGWQQIFSTRNWLRRVGFCLSPQKPKKTQTDRQKNP